MPDDKFNGRYIDQALVKGNWYGISSGPKPQEYTGNIDKGTDSVKPQSLENIRNKALLIVSPSSSNGTFPSEVIGHQSLVMTTRYSENIYLQRLVDIQGDSNTAVVEYERVYFNGWKKWERITSFGDASALAKDADQRSRTNADDIKSIKNKIDFSNSKTINSRVNSNTTSISELRRDCENSFRDKDSKINILNSDIGMIKNLNTSAYSKVGISVYSGSEIKDFSGDSVEILPSDWCSSRGVTGANSVLLVSNGSDDNGATPGQNHGVHVIGSSFVIRNGQGSWYAMIDRNSSVIGLRISYILFVSNQNWS